MSKSHHRKIWTDAYGPIPKDSDGRSYEIHHIDGDRTNNAIWNLITLSIQEHYDRHLTQGDYMACHYIAIRMTKSFQLMSELSSLAQKERVANGTHHFLGGEIQRRQNKKLSSEIQRRLVADGTHHLLGGEIQRRTNKKRLKAGTHQFQTVRICPHCGKTDKGPNMLRWHFNNCKHKREESNVQI